MTDLIRITAKHFCAGVEIDELKLTVVNTAPILKYMLNWKFKKVFSYCEEKKWKLEYLFVSRWHMFLS